MSALHKMLTRNTNPYFYTRFNGRCIEHYSAESFHAYILTLPQGESVRVSLVIPTGIHESETLRFGYLDIGVNGFLTQDIEEMYPDESVWRRTGWTATSIRRAPIRRLNC
jgi:hypothetical protein